MTLKDFTGAMVEADLFVGSQASLLVALFKASGSLIGENISEQTAKSWISGTRQCKVKEHFPNESIHESEFIRYINRRTSGDGWKKLQEAFRARVALQSDGDCIINFNTEKQRVFYWSILNQFQKLLRLPLSEDPVTAMVKTFKQLIEDNRLQTNFIDNSPSLNVDPGVYMEGLMKEVDEVFSKENGFYEFMEKEAKGYLDRYIVEVYGKDVDDFYSIPDRVRAFVQSVESDILEPFGISQSDNSVYNNIKEFNQTLSDLFAPPSPAMSKTVDVTKWDMLNGYMEMNVRNDRFKRLCVLYAEICASDV